MQPDDIAAEAENLIDRAPLRAAEEALAKAERDLQAARAAAAEADNALAAATGAFSDLVDAGGRGEAVTREQVIAAHTEARNAERWVTFCAAVARRMVEPVEEAQEALAKARHTAWAPVAQHGIALRVSAAVRADRTRARHKSPYGATMAEQVAAATAASRAIEAFRAEWDRGNAFLALATRNGHQPATERTLAAPQWPAREAHERAYWRHHEAVEVSDAA